MTDANSDLPGDVDGGLLDAVRDALILASQPLPDADAHDERIRLEARLDAVQNFKPDSISHKEHMEGIRDTCWICESEAELEAALEKMK